VALEPEVLGDLDIDALEFEAYVKHFGRKYEHGSKEYWLRRSLFEKRSAVVKAHNAKSHRLWEAVAGHLADFTEEEHSALLGYRSRSSHDDPPCGGKKMPDEVLADREAKRPIAGDAAMPTDFNWTHLEVASIVPNQGGCGSCWAEAAKSVLDAHHEIYMAKVRNFSVQQLVSCVPNVRRCGGDGKCLGSTVELAFDWVWNNGCATEEKVSYTGKDGTEATAKCSDSKALSAPTALYGEPHTHAQQSPLSPAALGGAIFGMQGCHRLPQNKEKDLREALYQHGPVAISIAASSMWMLYSHGIYDGCPQNGTGGEGWVVNHAVTLYGYGVSKETVNKKSEEHKDVIVLGKDGDPHITSADASPSQANPTKYWLIRNSWGTAWGEKGFIRMKRLDDEDSNCGTDDDNLLGVGCAGDKQNPSDKGDPKTVTVCGNCGFLWDSVVPHFYPSQSGSLAAKMQVEVDVSARVVRREDAYWEE